MKIGDKVWIPVKVVGMPCGNTIRVEYNDCGSEFWVGDSDVRTITTEDYRNALSEFYKMNAKERSEIWGLNLLSDVFQITAEEFVCKLRKHQNEPKTGQIWKDRCNQKVVVLRTEKSEVHYYRPCGNTSWVARNYFDNTFHNTGEVLTSIDAFLKDLEGLNEG